LSFFQSFDIFLIRRLAAFFCRIWPFFGPFCVRFGHFSTVSLAGGNEDYGLSNPCTSQSSANPPSTRQPTSLPKKPSSVEEIFEKYNLKVQQTRAQENSRELVYDIIPGANILFIDQQMGPMTLINIVVTYGGETVVESLAGKWAYIFNFSV